MIISLRAARPDDYGFAKETYYETMRWLIERLFSYLGVLNDWAPFFSAAFPLIVFACIAVSMQYYIERR